MNPQQATYKPAEAFVWTCEWGQFDIPDDVYRRAIRLEWRFGRRDYLTEWCRFQWQKGGV